MPTRHPIAFVTVALTLGFGISAAVGQGTSGDDAHIGKTERADGRGSNAEDVVTTIWNSPAALLLDKLALSMSGPLAASAELHVSVESNGSNSISVAPGAEVRYEVVGILSDDANEGLALVGFDLAFDGGDLSRADVPTGEPTAGCDNPMINFTRPWGITNPDSPCPPACGFGGTIIDGDLIQVGGGQNTINNTPDNAPWPIGPVLTGVAQPAGCGPAVIVTGTLTAPDIEGTYTLAAAELFANVIKEGETGDPYWVAEAIGVGTATPLTITVALREQVLIDIKPGSCPNPVNVRSRGVVTMAILGSESFDVTEIDIDSLVLTRADGAGEAVVPLTRRSGQTGAIEDVGTPFHGESCDCHDLSGDGYDDLVVKFSTQEMANLLDLDSEPHRASIMLTVSGSLLDGTEFEASDCVVIITGRTPGSSLRSTGKRSRR